MPSNPTDAGVEPTPAAPPAPPAPPLTPGAGQEVTSGPDRRGAGPLVITVIGLPVGQGNIRYNRAGRGYHANAADLKPWRTNIRMTTLRHIDRHDWLGPAKGTGPCRFCGIDKDDHALFRTSPIQLRAELVVPKPKSAPKRRRTWPTTRTSSDWDHLGRAISDALTGVIWRDDSQIVDGRVRKFFPDDPAAPLRIPGAVIAIKEITE